MLLLLTACSAGSDDRSDDAVTPKRSASPSSLRPSSGSPSPTSSSPVTQSGLPRPVHLRTATAFRTVQHLAGSIGPRHATSAAFRRAVIWTARRLRAFGYDVRRQPFPVPAGISWGVPVRGGRSVNLIAAGDDYRADRPYLVVGAHLDTVPQAPGAEDNASGLGVMLAVAQSVAGARTRLPVVFVAFGAEEPRGPTDLDHHYGSMHYVRALSAVERRDMRGMVALDRVGVGVGVGHVLPISGATTGPDALESALLHAAHRAHVTAVSGEPNRSSDHWSFVRAGLPGVRLGSTPYAGYHSPADVPSVVNRAQLARAGRTVLSWISGP